MPLLSSFELIVQPIVPGPIAAKLGLPDPVSVQAYFLLISNPTEKIALVQINFTANPNSQGLSTFNGGGIVPPGTAMNFGKISSFLNLAGVINFLNPPLFTINSNSSATATFSIPPLGTALFLLQPDVSPLKNFDKETEFFSYELRGYVEINAMPGVKLFCSPQIRGTFFELGKKGELLAPAILTPEAKTMSQEKLSVQPYSQQAYSLTTPGSSFFEF